MEFKTKKAKRKLNKENVIAIVVSSIALLGLICLFAGIITIMILLKDSPKFELSDFTSQESSIVYDKDGNQIYELGNVIRQNVEYEEIPSVLIDALVAVEDSRFYEHNGFDVPRFTRAFIDNIKTRSFGQGGSTLTMQLVKNTYFVSDEQGQGAAKSIKRKVQEIALAMKLENYASKREIITNYLNKQNFGGTNQNIRGIQKACQYYFGKDVKDLNLPEAAMLAGVLNSPYTYNPFNQVEDYAQERRDEVLYLMNYHGYISDAEYKLALATRVEDFLVKTTGNSRGANEGIPYQAYIDYVISEVYEVSGLDPYSTPMHIHTSMDSSIQKLMDNIQAGDVDDYFTYPDDEFEVASICVNNKTGEIVGILGGRNYSDGGALLLNHATDQYKQPGSSIKPILDYVQAFEVLGWSTSHALVDERLTYTGTEIPISNSTNRYDGEVTLKYAVGMSLNTPAIKTIRELIEKKGNNYLVDYLTDMGFDIDLTDFDEQYGIGGKGLNVSCLQLAGAYAAIMNEGYYTKPHAITKIEFLNEKAPIIPTYDKKKTVSEQSCFLMSDILRSNVEGGFPNLMGIFKNDNYKVYAKTGTTDWGSDGAAYNIPAGSIKDGWVVACTSNYSVATWMGYEKAQKNKISYMTYDVYNKNIKGKISKLILDETATLYENAPAIEKPSGISTIRHISKVGLPYVAPIEGMDEKYIVTGYINSESQYVNLASPAAVSVENIDEGSTKISMDGTTISIKWPDYPKPEQMIEEDDDDEHKGVLFNYAWVYGGVKYKADVSIFDTNGNEVKSLSYVSDDNSESDNLRDYLQGGYSVKACAYYGFKNQDINSNKACVSGMKISDEITINIPSTKSATVLQEALSKYANVEIVTKSDGSKEDGEIDLIMITNKEEKNITNYMGGSIPVHSLDLRGFRVVVYKERVSITLSKNLDTILENRDVIFTVSVKGTDKTIEWYIDGAHDSSHDGDSSITIKFNEGSHTIEVRCGEDSSGVNTYDVIPAN